VVMLNKGVSAKMAEGAEQGELLRDVFSGGDSHTTSLLYGGGAALVNSSGTPWTAAYIDSIGDPTADLRSNIAAESRAKIIYERLINCTSDPDVQEALGFLMTREIAHQKSFEKALYAIEPNFPAGKLPGMPQFSDTYYNMSSGAGDERGPWNQGEQWEFEADPLAKSPVDGGEGTATVNLSTADADLALRQSKRLACKNNGDPTTGADLGAGPGAGATKRVPAE